MRVITRRQTLKGGLALGAVASGVIRSAADARAGDFSAHAVVSPAGGGMDRSAAHRQRSPRRHDLRRHCARTPATQRRHAVCGRTLRPFESRRARGAAACARADRRREISRRAESGRGEDDGAAPPHAVVPDRGRSDSQLRHFGVCAGLSARPRSRQRLCARAFRARGRDLHARIVCLGRGPGHRHAHLGGSPGRAGLPRGLRNADARRRRDRGRTPGAQRPQRGAGGHRRKAAVPGSLRGDPAGRNGRTARR